jgi:hypothetical protein
LLEAAADAGEHFGFLGLGVAASSTRTRELLNWAPTGPALVEDVLAGACSSTS